VWLRHLLWPLGGWNRAFEYVTYRLKRLPDSPHRISLGLSAGVFASFTPFYGFHFVIAFLIARLIRGNILASLTGTFFGNPLTYVPIGIVSLELGDVILGTHSSFKNRALENFSGAWEDLGNNIIALFSSQVFTWHRLEIFFYDVFLPYSVGCIIPGFMFAFLCYFISFPLISVYQNRRRGFIKMKMSKFRKKKDGS